MYNVHYTPVSVTHIRMVWTLGLTLDFKLSRPIMLGLFPEKNMQIRCSNYCNTGNKMYVTDLQ